MFRSLSLVLVSIEKRFFKGQIRYVCGTRHFSAGNSSKENLDELYKKFTETDSHSLLKKHLTQKVFDELKKKKTPNFKSSLLDCVQSGLKNPDSHVGIYAPDPEAYKTFAPIFDPIISEYHGGFEPTDSHPPSDFGDVSEMSDLDPECKYIVSTRVRCGRSVKGYPFNPTLTEQGYSDLEDCIFSALCKLKGELAGVYEDLCSMPEERKKQLIDEHFLFKEGDRFLQAANASRFWPVGRGIFLNEKKTFLVWVNEEDHLRIISMQKGGDLGAVYKRMVNGVTSLGKSITFMHDKRLGFLTFCPTNLGTTIRASVHIALPILAKDKSKLEQIASEFNLQVRGTSGEHSESVGGVYDVSNKRRLGLTEYEAVMEMACGITALIEMEKKAEKENKPSKTNSRCFSNNIYHT